MKIFTVYGYKPMDERRHLVFCLLAGTPGCFERGKRTAKQHGFTSLEFHEQPSIANCFGARAANPFTIHVNE